MSFKAWLKQFHKDDTGLGDLARDVWTDPDWPRGRSLKCFTDHFERCGASEEARKTLGHAWELYVRRGSSER